MILIKKRIGYEKRNFRESSKAKVVFDLYSGTKLVKACTVDMFPNTVHVETVVLLSKML